MYQFFFARAVKSLKRKRYIVIAENEKEGKKLLMEQEKLKEKQIYNFIHFHTDEKGVWNVSK